MYNAAKEPLHYKDISIIDALPNYDCPKTVLSVGCGPARIDRYLSSIGYRVYATDLERYGEWEGGDEDLLTYHSGVNIFDLNSFPIPKSPIVICSEVLEHFSQFKEAFGNLMTLAETRLIITIPHRKSFNVLPIHSSSPHCNFWDDGRDPAYRNINEFRDMAGYYSVAISKIITKQADYDTGARGYLIVVDKRWPKAGGQA